MVDGKVASPTNGRFTPGSDFCYMLTRPQSDSAAGRIKSMTNSNDIIGNRTPDLLGCKAVPQATVRRRIRLMDRRKWCNAYTKNRCVVRHDPAADNQLKLAKLFVSVFVDRSH
jgi:hypothetical protein